MKAHRLFTDYLRDMLEAGTKIFSFTAGMDFDQFARDDKTTFAVVRALEVVGEAAKKIPPSVREKHPEIPWTSVTGMRDKLTHEYFGVDLRVVWRTVQEDIPPLMLAIAHILGAAGESDGRS
jgi:uncharacterized protein with HEPN domain